MNPISSSTNDKPTQDELKKVEDTLDAFNTMMERTLPPGLNSRLTRPERALLRTFLLWLSREPVVLRDVVEEDDRL
jgi:hypothetical protein